MREIGIATSLALQLRHLRYFVKIVEAGSISRAAAMIHVAQPALSQQISELEQRLGVALLQRHARGVRPTQPGLVLYREASAILKQIEQLPSLLRSTGGEPEGAVSLGMSTTLADELGGPFLQACRAALPKVLVQFRLTDSETMKQQIVNHELDMAVVFEDDVTAGFARRTLFRQRLYYAATRLPEGHARALPISALAELPLVMPTAPNVTRGVLERAFASAGVQPDVVSEGNQLGSVLSIVRLGLAGTVLPKGSGLTDPATGAPMAFLPVEPPLYLTASVVWSRDAAPSRAGEALLSVLIEFMEAYAREAGAPGLETIEP
jgi:LysR family nitrogen assimilation transcriptional regulator